MPRYLIFALIGITSATLLWGGCTKSVKPEAAAPVEEKIVAQPETVVPPEIGEAEVAAKEETGSLATVYFDYDKSSVRPDMRTVLQSNGRWLLANKTASVTIEGHADERGTNEYNLALGERRAQALKKFLTAMGVEAGRLSTISYGEERPVCSESQETCWWKNRRAIFSTK